MGRVTVDVKFAKSIKALNDLGDNLSRFGQSYVAIGVQSDAGNYEDSDVSVVEVALYNEFGTSRIPERSFLRSTFENHAGKINELRNLAIANVAYKNWSVEKALAMIGQNVVFMIQNAIRAGITPPNAPSTLRQKIEKKQGTTPLIRLGSEKLIRSITYKVVLG